MKVEVEIEELNELKEKIDSLENALANQTYMGNSISYIYDKMMCYKKQVGELAKRAETLVMPKIAGELLKYLDGVIETRKNGYTNNYREMLMKEAHLEAFENVKGWLINKLNESNFTA